MLRSIVAAFFVIVIASATLVHAAGIFFVVVDTNGYCAVVAPKPAPDTGLTIIGEGDGYASKEAADAALKATADGTCKNISK